MKKISILILAMVLLPTTALATDVLAAGWWNASVDELVSARMQIDNQIVSLGGELPSIITPTPIPTATPASVIQYVYVTPVPTQEAIHTSSPAPSNMVRMPDVCNMSEEEAKVVLSSIGLFVKTKTEYNDNANSIKAKKGQVMFQSKAPGLSVEKGTIITLSISKGARKIVSDQATWYAWWVKGSDGDNYDFVGTPHIRENELIIKLKATMNSKYKHLWRGYGTAAINDTFDKVVPITVAYEREEMKRGEEQEITIIIPIQDLNVDRPTTISTKLEMYYGNKKNEESVRMDFTFSWPEE